MPRWVKDIIVAVLIGDGKLWGLVFLPLAFYCALHTKAALKRRTWF